MSARDWDPSHRPTGRTRPIRLVSAAVGVIVLIGSVSACTADESASSTDFCSALRRVPSLASVLSGFADQQPGQLTRALDDAETAFEHLGEAAPEEIAPDVTAVVDLVRAVIDAVRSNPSDPDKAAAAVRGAVKEHDRAVTSSLAVADYARTKCHVELNPTVPRDTAATTAPASTTPTTKGN